MATTPERKIEEFKEVMKNGIIGRFNEDEMFIYCNELDENRGSFLFKCCEVCEHNK